jgi:hypothetical protein
MLFPYILFPAGNELILKLTKNTAFGYHFCLMILLKISGSLYDAIGNYESGFYFSGTMIFISGVMLFVLPWMQRRQAAQNLVSGHPSMTSRNL